VREISHANFGYVIAYLLPGFVIIWELQGAVPLLRTWLGTTPTDAATIGGFLFATLAAIGAGMMAHTGRWILVDSIHHATGVVRPSFRFRTLGSRIGAFEYLIEIHYRYYQFYGNMVVALLVAYAIPWNTGAASSIGWRDVGFVVLEALLFTSSRDCLQKYYRRVDELLRDDDDRAIVDPPRGTPRPEGRARAGR
jgi:hypothetical protein